MNVLRSSASVVLALVLVGCQSPDVSARFGQSLWGDYKHAKAWLADHRHVMLLCVKEERTEDRGPHEYSLWHFNGTVVKTYKGDWNASERIAFVHGLDYQTGNTTNANVHRLLFLFTNEHRSTEFGVETGEFYSYDPEIDRQLCLIYSGTKE